MKAPVVERRFSAFLRSWCNPHGPVVEQRGWGLREAPHLRFVGSERGVSAYHS